MPSYLCLCGMEAGSTLAQWEKVRPEGGAELPLTVILSGQGAVSIQH